MLVQINYEKAVKYQKENSIIIRGKDKVFEIIDAKPSEIYNNQKELFFIDLEFDRVNRESFKTLVDKRNIFALIASLLGMFSFLNWIFYYYQNKGLENLIYCVILAIPTIPLLYKAMNQKDIDLFIEKLINKEK